MRLGYGETLKKRFNLNRDIVWKSAPNAGGLDVWVTQPAETAALGSDNKEHITPVRWALVNLRTHVVVIVFNLGSRSVEEAKPYSAAVDRIVATIKPVETR